MSGAGYILNDSLGLGTRGEAGRCRSTTTQTSLAWSRARATRFRAAPRACCPAQRGSNPGLKPSGFKRGFGINMTGCQLYASTDYLRVLRSSRQLTRWLCLCSSLLHRMGHTREHALRQIFFFLNLKRGSVQACTQRVHPGPSAVVFPPYMYDCLNLYGVFNSKFCPRKEKRLRNGTTILKSLNGQTKAVELETRVPEFCSLRLPLKHETNKTISRFFMLGAGKFCGLSQVSRRLLPRLQLMSYRLAGPAQDASARTCA
jgi:hypothetical protein